jgi:hypothetical protein
MIEGTYRSLLAAAVAYGITTDAEAAALLAAEARDAERHPDRPVLFPLMIGAWKRKP